MASYQHHPSDYITFGKIMEGMNPKTGERKPTETKIAYLGNEVRFKDMKNSKSKSIVIVPGPGHY